MLNKGIIEEGINPGWGGCGRAGSRRNRLRKAKAEENFFRVGRAG